MSGSTHARPVPRLHPPRRPASGAALREGARTTRAARLRALATLLAASLASNAPLRAQDVGSFGGDDAIDVTGRGQAFVEQVLEPASVYLHQRFRLRARFGFEQEFFERSLIQSFRRSLDVPAQLELAWWSSPTAAGGLEGALPLEADPAAAGAGADDPTLALGGAVVRARRAPDEQRDGSAYYVYELEREFTPVRAGALAVPAPLLRFAYATRFEDDLLAGRVPADRVDALVRGAALELAVAELPEEGRPLTFTNAVGRFTLAARAHLRQLEVGQSLTLTLHVEGEGDLTRFDAPRLEGFERFRVLGHFDYPFPNRRIFTFDLAPLGVDVRAVPPVAFSFFDPGPPAQYRTVWSEPIALSVLEPLAPDERRPSEPEPVAPAEDPNERGSGRWLWWLMALTTLELLAWLILWTRRRRRAPHARTAPPAGAARAAFEAELARGESGLSDALAEYLAAQLECTRAAVIGPDLAVRLERAGVPAELAARTAARMEELVAARFGGATPADGAKRARELVDALEIAFESARAQRRTR